MYPVSILLLHPRNEHNYVLPWVTFYSKKDLVLFLHMKHRPSKSGFFPDGNMLTILEWPFLCLKSKSNTIGILFHANQNKKVTTLQQRLFLILLPK